MDYGVVATVRVGGGGREEVMVFGVGVGGALFPDFQVLGK